MSDFTPLPAFAGGLLIGTSALLLGMRLGHIAGISGILGGLLAHKAHDRGWRLSFLVGLPIGALAVWTASLGERPQIESGPLMLAAAGVLVGFGTRLGGGCTSGHGVCGMARGSKRSITATFTFMGAGAITVYVMRHVLGV
jgi:uncharacterized membrane protein YedE/YeeE